jgi:hypothetical protein
MSSNITDLHHLIISAWVDVLQVSKFRPDKGEVNEALLAFTNTNILVFLHISISDQFKKYSSLVETHSEDDPPITLTTFLPTNEDVFLEKMIDVNGVFWPNSRKFDDTEHIVVRLDESRLYW